MFNSLRLPYLDSIVGRRGVDDARMNTARKLACERRIARWRRNDESAVSAC
jgi:hypothetical protein